ncbi:MAG: DUF302 domain-containing protein [Sphingomonadales bacterium]|nr:DUF302 domain-containing protein [Sphingomonadales bacterium]
MSYTIDRTLTGVTMQEAEARTRAALAAHGLGVLTEIDVAATMHKKLGREMMPYRILGACQPQFAWEALSHDQKIGSMLPCNVILRAVEGGVEVSAVDPIASLQAVENPGLAGVAEQVRLLLGQVIADL